MIGVTVLISTCMYGLLFMIPLNSRTDPKTEFGRSYNKFTSKYVHCKLLQLLPMHTLPGCSRFCSAMKKSVLKGTGYSLVQERLSMPILILQKSKS